MRGSVEDWFAGQARKRARACLLEDTLLGQHFATYAAYRLRFFGVRMVSDLAAHLVRYLLLYHLFSARAFVSVVLAHVSVNVSSSLWWGALEALREHVRILRRAGHHVACGRAVARWLALSLVFSAVILLVAAVWLWATTVSGDGLDPARAYVATMALQLPFRLWVRTLHSGVFAVRRVYRPAWSLVISRWLDLAIVALAWRWLGLWSFSVGAASAAVVGIAISVLYARRAYSDSGVKLEALFCWHLRPLLRRSVLATAAPAAVAFAGMRLDALLVLGFAVLGAAQPVDAALFAFFFAVGPLVRAGFDWTQLFYFDLKRLEPPALHTLRRRFEGSLLRLSLLLGIGFGLLASGFASLLYQRYLGFTYLPLIAFFIVRCLLAAMQTVAFSSRGYGAVCLSVVVHLAGVSTAATLLNDNDAVLFAMSASALAGCGALALRVRRRLEVRGPLRVLPPMTWARRLVDLPGATHVCSVTVSPRLREHPRIWVRMLPEQIAHRLGGGCRVTSIHPDRIVWYEPDRDEPLLSETALVEMSGGQLVGVTRVRGASGREALVAVLTRGLLGRRLHETADLWRTGDEALSDYRRTFPEGQHLDLAGSVPAWYQGLDIQDRRRVLFDAIRFATHLRNRPRPDSEVTALCLGGELGLIFSVDGAACERTRRAWRTRVSMNNLLHATRRA